MMFETRQLPAKPDVVAPDGSDVRIMLRLAGGSMAHFELPPGGTSMAVAHRSVEEIWYFLGGTGEFWRCLTDHEEVVPIQPSTCISIPLGTHFQFRSFGPEPLAAVGVTMPPWPGDNEAYPVPGKWSQVESSS
jgi:mannose-6-phosphate isomerase-like protein (cupin superfamily)